MDELIGRWVATVGVGRRAAPSAIAFIASSLALHRRVGRMSDARRAIVTTRIHFASGSTKMRACAGNSIFARKKTRENAVGRCAGAGLRHDV
jgi:hypothetical protein